MIFYDIKTKGLTDSQAIESGKKFGYNITYYKKQNKFLIGLANLIREPMILLLFVAAAIYFLSGKTGDGFFLISAILLIATISLYQESRSRIALEKLKNFTKAKAKVIRNGEIKEIIAEELVLGDSLVIEEGVIVSADGIIKDSNDFSLNEAILTGESFPVFKDKSLLDNYCYQGTHVASGMAIIKITAIGNQTKLAKIGKSIESIEEEKTPLEIQINRFLKKMVFIGAVIFTIVWIINLYQTKNILDSLTKSLTLAMSILPEEIPVSFTTFMALGAWRLMKTGIIVKQIKTVETLGSATVICIDKTGTITENKMSIAKIYLLSENEISDSKNIDKENEKELISLAMWASETEPFDEMEKAIKKLNNELKIDNKRHNYRMIQEYPLEGTPPMMTHIFEDAYGNRIISAKGAPEALIKVSDLNQQQISDINSAIDMLAGAGYRLLGIGKCECVEKSFPEKQQEFKFKFKGLLAFYDPPKPKIREVIAAFYEAGIAVKIITGDYSATTKSIAQQIGFKNSETCISGEELMKLNDSELKKAVLETDIFTRMFPDAKLKIINALKENNEIVAMTGDGVNDGPALKAAHIGISMGKKGTEIAKQASSLILVDDDLSKMIEAIAMGRKIYTNLKKAIQYIISIHIPIILSVFIPLILNWKYPNIFSPVHVIFLELIMGPTCSIIYENEPIEKNAMKLKPRPITSTFFNNKELNTSIIQGLVITAGALIAYQIGLKQYMNENLIRTSVFIFLISSNIFLTLVNRSFYYSFFTTLKNSNDLIYKIIFLTISLTLSIIYIDPIALFFGFEKLNILQLITAVSLGFISVFWFEIFKWKIRKDSPVKV